MSFTGSRLAWVLSALALAACPARATSVTVTSVGLRVNSVAMIVNGNASNYLAGQILITLDGTPLISYCVDLFTSIGYATYDTTIQTPLSLPNGTRAAWLFENYAPSVTTNDGAAALQLALWDIVHDGGDGFAAGNIQLAPAAPQALLDAASALVTVSLNQYSTKAYILHNVNIGSGLPAQALITNVPEPGTLLLLGAGFLALLVRKRTHLGLRTPHPPVTQ